MEDYKYTFTNIYQNYGFGGDESHSGPGSTVEQTKTICKNIVKIIEEKDIKTVVDVPCGDFNWMKEISSKISNYIGGDLVEECIDENKKKYGNDNFKFIVLDLLNDHIPDGDLLIVRDVIGHFPLEDGIKIIKNILRSNNKYLLSTTWYNINDDNYYKRHVNDGTEYGRFYPVNLMSFPFNFPKPEKYIEEDVVVDGYTSGVRKVLALWNIQEIRDHVDAKNNIAEDIKKYIDSLGMEEKKSFLEHLNIIPDLSNYNKDLTVVTGLWNIGRPGRDFSHYIENFKRFLDIPVNMFIYIQPEYEYLVWEKRNKKNTYVKVYSLDDVKRLYDPFWNKTQEIRTNPDWFNSTGEGGWLANSPQAVLEWYNPIVQSKMFLLNDVTFWNPFDNEYFIWLDAGITNTVNSSLLSEKRALDKIIPFLDSFLFLSYPYEANDEIHGFNFKQINSFAGDIVKHVCRGGLFGGKKEIINQASSTYYSTLGNTLNSGLMGTEESIFSIMAYREPSIYRRYMLDENGFISKFIEALINDTAELEEIKEYKTIKSVTNYDLSRVKTNLYILTFNFPDQLQYTIDIMLKTPDWLTKPHIVLLDNSTDDNAIIGNKIIAEKYNFEYMGLGGNTGICGGRQAAAEHFDTTDANFYIFHEDDMSCNPPELEGQFCRNGFRKYVPNLYEIIHKIMLKEDFDFLKLSFTEVYFDNDKSLPWYNVPQHIRTRDWPNYDRLPITGLDPNSPPAEYKYVKNCDGLSYLIGDVNYANWPMIMNKRGNQKIFLDTKWAHPYEQTWSSHVYQLTKEGNINSGILLASPIWHERIKYYKPEERREN